MRAVEKKAPFSIAKNRNRFVRDVISNSVETIYIFRFNYTQLDHTAFHQMARATRRNTACFFISSLTTLSVQPLGPSYKFVRTLSVWCNHNTAFFPHLPKHMQNNFFPFPSFSLTVPCITLNHITCDTERMIEEKKRLFPFLWQ